MRNSKKLQESPEDGKVNKDENHTTHEEQIDRYQSRKIQF